MRLTNLKTASAATQSSQQEPAASVPQSQSGQRKTQEELDRELMAKMSGLAGDGGESGVEYEDGKPVAMKRSVSSNMFRYI